MARKIGEVSKARYREKPCKGCGKPHRNQYYYCSNACRNRDRKGKLSEEWREKLSNAQRESKRRNHNENTMYALLNNLKKQKNPDHDPEALFIMGYNIMDMNDPIGDSIDGDVWTTIE